MAIFTQTHPDGNSEALVRIPPLHHSLASRCSPVPLWSQLAVKDVLRTSENMHNLYRTAEEKKWTPLDFLQFCIIIRRYYQLFVWVFGTSMLYTSKSGKSLMIFLYFFFALMRTMISNAVANPRTSNFSGHHRSPGERSRKSKRSTVFPQMTRKGHRPSKTGIVWKATPGKRLRDEVERILWAFPIA